MPTAPRISSRYYERLFAVMFPNYLGDVNATQVFAGRLDEVRLQQAFLSVLADEPMWSHRFVEHAWTPYWEPVPREQRSALFTVSEFADDASRTSAIERQMGLPPLAAMQLGLYRTPGSDLLWYRGDHRLTDATSVRMFVESVTDAYQRRAVPSATDGPVVRRTVGDIKQFSVKDRRQLLKGLIDYHKKRVKIREFKIAPPTPEAPFVLPRMLHYPEGSSAALAARALQDRTTPIYVIGAVVYCALREMFSFPDQLQVPINYPVDLRRYLPPESRRAQASMYVGDASVFIDPAEGTDLAGVLAQVRTKIAEQRGRFFGAYESPLAVELPLLGKFLQWYPYWIMRRRIRRRMIDWETTPGIMITDLGSYAHADWDGVRLQHAYCAQGKMEFPAVMIGYTTCGSRFSLSVGSGNQKFISELSSRIDAGLAHYMGQPPLLETNRI
jgi:NRPS condensation-like uncharacterized protein